MARSPAPGTRDRILDTAGRLFAEHGVRGVGLQQVVDECGCGKNLLYREFASKDDLVAAYLERNRVDWRERMAAAIATTDDPVGQLLEIVRSAVGKVAGPDFRGCPFLNTHAEFPDPDHPAHQVAVDQLAEERALLRGIAEQAGAADPGALADRIVLILQGVNANAAVLGADGAATSAVAFADDVIRAAVPKRARRRSARSA
jgi:AcrR family transcriptional regulator